MITHRHATHQPDPDSSSAEAFSGDFKLWQVKVLTVTITNIHMCTQIYHIYNICAHRYITNMTHVHMDKSHTLHMYTWIHDIHNTCAHRYTTYTTHVHTDTSHTQNNLVKNTPGGFYSCATYSDSLREYTTAYGPQ